MLLTLLLLSKMLTFIIVFNSLNIYAWVTTKRVTKHLSISLPVIDRFSKFFTGTFCGQFTHHAADTSLHCQTTDTGLVHRAVCLRFTSHHAPARLS